MKTKLSSRFWVALTLFSLVGQVAWVVENISNRKSRIAFSAVACSTPPLRFYDKSFLKMCQSGW